MPGRTNLSPLLTIGLTRQNHKQRKPSPMLTFVSNRKRHMIPLAWKDTGFE